MKHWDRREFLRTAGFVSAASLAKKLPAQTRAYGAAQPPRPKKNRPDTLDASKLTPFVDPLPLPERILPTGHRSDAGLGAENAPYHTVRVRAISARLHRDLPPTRLWSYGSSAAPVLLEAQRDQPILIDWINDLPPHHILPLDPPMRGMEHAPPTRIITHNHGARVPSISDGYPEDWFGPGHHRLGYYPNHQDAAALWIHDHAMSVSRMNVIAGLMGWYVIHDPDEAVLDLPSGRYEIPLLVYDRSFTPAGQLYYPNPPDQGAWSEEFLGDAVLVNGKVQPFLNVEPRKYRFRIANTANSRFFAFALSSGQPFHVIGSDQGLLSAPMEMTRLLLGPAERTDIIVDFSAMRGQHVRLISDTLDILEFHISETPVQDDSRLPATLRLVERIPESQAIRTRLMTLNEYDGDSGAPMTMLLNRKHWSDPVTEIVKQNTTEIWSLANLTEDTHPIHLHMVRFQILDRRNFSVDDYLTDETLRFTGPIMQPSPQEMGWKDIVQCPPGTITRIIVPFTPYAGRYLWHCHILEHEANDMMRPFLVEASS